MNSAVVGTTTDRSQTAARAAGIVLFDIGNVLVDWNPRYLYRKLFADEGAMEAFLRDVCTMAWHGRHDAGLSMDVSIAELTARFPAHADAIAAWKARWPEMFSGPIDGVVALAERLHASGAPLFALSNLPAEKRGHIEELLPILGRFRDVVVSGEHGVLKPDPRIYALAAARIGAPPGEVLFIDDRAENIAAAVAFGFKGHLYTTPEALEAALVEAGLLESAHTV